MIVALLVPSTVVIAAAGLRLWRRKLAVVVAGMPVALGSLLCAAFVADHVR